MITRSRGRKSLRSKPNIIFSTNFSNDTGYSASGYGSLEYTNVPTGFDAIRCQGASSLEVLPVGINGSNALRISYDPALGQPTCALLKHLTQNTNTGFNELFVRFRVKLPNAFKWGDGTSPIDYWKWMRLAQNEVWPSPFVGENRADSFYVVTTCGWNPAYNEWCGFSSAWGANAGDNLTSGSAGGYHCVVYHESGSRPPAIPGWTIDKTTNVGFLQTYTDSQAQDWVTVEFRYRLATSETAQNGIFHAHYNNVKQNEPDRFVTAYNTLGLPAFTGAPTANHNGFNIIGLYDNMATLNVDWDEIGVDGYIDVNDFAVATNRIGHEYNP